MRSRTCSTKLEREAETFTRLRRQERDWKLRRMNFKPLWKRLKLLWNRKKTRYSAPNWNCPKSVKKSTAASKRKKRNSRTPARTTKERWTPCKHHWKPRPRVKLRHSA
uniref:Uncharacterized protein n=1 Tax=Cacopsylla melanoneura TaxID=428564 RepID=A0A8D9BNS5_9HEMI